MARARRLSHRINPRVLGIITGLKLLAFVAVVVVAFQQIIAFLCSA